MSPGEACCHSCHSNVHTGGLTFLFFLPLFSFLFSSTWLCYSLFQTAVACEKSSPVFIGIGARERKSRSGGSWQLLCAPSSRWQMCHIVRADTCLAAANGLTAALFVTCHFLFLFFPSQCDFLDHWSTNLPSPQTSQLADRHRNDLTARSNLKKKSGYKNIGEAIRRFEFSRVCREEKLFSPVDGN